MINKLLLNFALLSCLATPAAADHWKQTADPQVVQALNELLSVYGGYCQQGNPQACAMMQSVQSHGMQMLNASYDCKAQGNQQACNWYGQAYQALSSTYSQMQTAMNQGQFAAAPRTDPNPLGSTHQERMQSIQQWGQERLQWGADHSKAMDDNHAKFMERLRN
jgi:hypothetical protein